MWPSMESEPVTEVLIQPGEYANVRMIHRYLNEVVRSEGDHTNFFSCTPRLDWSIVCLPSKWLSMTEQHLPGFIMSCLAYSTIWIARISFPIYPSCWQACDDAAGMTMHGLFSIYGSFSNGNHCRTGFRTFSASRPPVCIQLTLFICYWHSIRRQQYTGIAWELVFVSRSAVLHWTLWTHTYE